MIEQNGVGVPVRVDANVHLLILTVLDERLDDEGPQLADRLPDLSRER